jgi:hypothetical protein
MKGIKRLVICMDLEMGTWISDCQHISKFLFLEYLHIDIDVWEDKLEDLAQGKYRFSTLEYLGELNVRKKVSVSIQLMCMDEVEERFRIDQYRLDEEALEAYIEEIQRKYEPIVQDLICPYNLRPVQVALTKEQAYLKDRAANLNLLRGEMEERDTLVIPTREEAIMLN